MNNNLSNKHKYFIQFVLTNGLVPLDKALSFFEKFCSEENSMTHLKTLIIEINRAISNQSFKIATTTCEVTGEKVIIWLNTKNDDISRLQAGFTALELEYFHVIMQEIITSDNYCIMYPRCINISSTLTGNMTRENGEKTLNRLIHGGYFVKRNEKVYLGPRTILEFTSYLRTNTENCICNLCSELVFVGETCASCEKVFHSFCIEKYLQNQHRCPNCKEEWETRDNVTMEVDSEEAGPSHRYD